ncbi:MAG: hypothetical protein ABJK39_00730 [Hyphomicrobiales bacterium]
MQSQAIRKPLLVSCLLMSAGLAACTPFWPQSGYGGFAEHRFGANGSLAHDRFDSGFTNANGKTRLSNVLQKNGYTRRGRSAEAKHVHDFAIIAFDERIAYLKSRGAERCAPGDLAKGEQLLVRVKRQWVSDLYGDALIDMERLEHRLDVVDKRIFHGHCQRTKVVVDAPVQTKTKVYKRPVYNNEPIVLK